MSELKPCPFCGGTDIDSSFMRGYAKGDRTQPIIAAGCNDCGAMGPDVRVPDHSTGYDAAAEKWNARALMGWGEPVAWQFYDPGTGRWHDFMNEQHRRNTADAGYEIRALYTQAPAVSSDPARFRQIGFTRIDHIGKPSSTIISDVKYRAVSDAGVYVPVFVDEGETQAPAVGGAVIREAIRTMDDGERLDIFSEYCRCCGSNDPTCQCWNDE